MNGLSANACGLRGPDDCRARSQGIHRQPLARPQLRAAFVACLVLSRSVAFRNRSPDSTPHAARPRVRHGRLYALISRFPGLDQCHRVSVTGPSRHRAAAPQRPTARCPPPRPLASSSDTELREQVVGLRPATKRAIFELASDPADTHSSSLLRELDHG